MITELKREDAVPGEWYPIVRAPKDHHLLLVCREGCSTELGHYNTALGRWVAAWDHRPLQGVTHFQYVSELPKV